MELRQPRSEHHHELRHVLLEATFRREHVAGHEQVVALEAFSLLLQAMHEWSEKMHKRRIILQVGVLVQEAGDDAVHALLVLHQPVRRPGTAVATN
eukprot:CAMPEP_0196795154 /NCGR_PEP_ID=MMETSP1104-20130614/35555_1 /TAXON_ID=33652 /ORGANISM="Cafeteria sp., Strain Caron Lab Isolate" /LENGTH=95 /DNA_ID=CAMNT_0042165543 /DNA_START=162 /DNA_END=446 /DNA_ORIENTATION=-